MVSSSNTYSIGGGLLQSLAMHISVHLSSRLHSNNNRKINNRPNEKKKMHALADS